ncbi:MAG: 50S ribosomal protein L31 [Clostridium sp.]
MNKEIQPEFETTTVTCACGRTYETKSTKKDLKVDVCAACHPYLSGSAKTTKRGGRADRFKEKYGV